jgi:hypothetical protein
MESPTMKHCEALGHEIPPAPGSPTEVTGGTLAVFQVRPAFDVVRMVVETPEEPPPTTMQCSWVLHVTRARLFSPTGSGTSFHRLPNRVVTSATPNDLSTVEPTAMQNPLSGHEMLVSWPIPFGILETTVQLRPPSSDRIAEPVSVVPTILPPTAMQRSAVGHASAVGCALAAPNRVLAHSDPPSVDLAAMEASGTVTPCPPIAMQV